MQQEKQCKRCGVEKPMADFYAHQFMSDGHLNICKECKKAEEKDRRYSPKYRQRILDYDRKRIRKTANKSRINNPLKYKARVAVSNAIRDNRIQKENCVFCGDPNTEAHHEDYSKPLNVIWVCFKHHREKFHQQKVG